MTSQQLKNSILQMAVQGLLVPQDPNDEPASVLLQRIREEKQKLVKEGKIKKEKHSSVIFRGSDNLPYESRDNSTPVCIAELLPFEIPDSWEWARLGEVVDLMNGDRGKNYPSKSKLSKTGIPFISALNLDGNTVVQDENLLCLSEEQFSSLRGGKLQKNDLLLCIRGSLGKHGIFPFEKGAIASSLVILRPLQASSVFLTYLTLWLDSPLFFSEIRKYDNGTAQPNLAAKNLALFFIPIPPLAEQRRIVAKLEELLPLVEEYGKAESTLTTLNATFPEALKKSILQDAVQGKLVPQDPDDEPASVLLERIRQEKKALDKTKKGKRNPVESRIVRRDNSYYELRDGVERCVDDLLPFEIPESWEWARLGEVILLLSGQDLVPQKYNAQKRGIPYITGASNFVSNSLEINRWTEFGKNIAEKGSLLITCKGTIGSMAILEEPMVHLARQVMGIQPLGRLDAYFLQYYLETRLSYLKTTAQSMIPGISRQSILELLIPIPPLAEQRRIVAKLEEIFKHLDLQELN